MNKAGTYRTAASVLGALLLATAAGTPVAAAETAPSTMAASSGPFSLQLNYLIWSVSGDKLPALVSTGVLNAPGTQVLYGSSTVDDDWRSGGEITAGYRFDPARNAGLEFSFFDLGDASSRFGGNSSAYPTLALPFINANIGGQDTLLAASPGLLSGSVTASDTSRFLGMRALYRRDLATMGAEHFGVLVGYRFLYESDQLDIASNSTVLGGGAIPVGTVIAERNAFNATNAFHGVDFGLTGETAEGPWHIEWRAQLALGADVNGANISGATTTNDAGATTSAIGGLFALTSNIGDHSQARFAVAPEFSLKAGYEIAPSWLLQAGYDLIYWTGVQRAGALIDTTVNPNLIPPGGGGGPSRPAAHFSTTALLAQGFTLGVKHDF